MKQKTDAYPIKVEAQHIGLFETPIAYSRVQNAESMLRDLETVIRSRMDAHVGLKRSNIGGWHSDTEMLDWGGPAATKLA